MKVKFILGAILIAGFIYSCDKPANYNTQGGNLPTHYIKILNDSFSPQQITVAVGSSITFVNNSDVTHTLVSDDSSTILSQGILPSTSFYFKKDTVAVIGYHCHEHPAVRGYITIRP
jgi:plastocyanin